MDTQHEVITETLGHIDFDNCALCRNWGYHLVTTKRCESLKLTGTLHATLDGWQIYIRKDDQDYHIYKATGEGHRNSLETVQELGMRDFEDIMKGHVEEWAEYEKTRPKNTLIIYEGGGYEGCFWEPNALLFDKNGKFVSIHHSGYKGIEKESLALQLAATKENPLSHYGSKNDTEIVDLTNDEQVEEWQSNNNEGFVVGICDKIAQLLGNDEIELDAKPWFECDVCKERVDNGVSDGPEGAGGLAIVNTEKICHDCYDENTCSTCGEFRIDAEEFELRVAQDVDGCEYCCWCIEDVPRDEIEIPLDDELVFEDTYKITTNYPVVGLTAEATVNTGSYSVIVKDEDNNIFVTEFKLTGLRTKQLHFDLPDSIMPLNDIKRLTYDRIRQLMRDNFDEAINNIYK